MERQLTIIGPDGFACCVPVKNVTYEPVGMGASYGDRKITVTGCRLTVDLPTKDAYSLQKSFEKIKEMSIKETSFGI